METECQNEPVRSVRLPKVPDPVDPDPGHWRELDAPRVAPLELEELNVATRGIAKAAELAVGGGRPPNVFLTLGRHPRLFAAWLTFAAQLMPRGSLPREDTELVILRVAWNARCRYEWDHHVRIGRKAGLDDATIERVAAGPDADGWSPRQLALLSAVDELQRDGLVSDPTWLRLSAHYDEKRLVEFLMLAGHYEMLAKAITSLGIQPERPRS
jgi:AhpD family alkylhydroperoxidase